jgi:SRP-independent targeting protein 2/TMEM208
MYFLSASLAGWLQFQLESVGRPTFDEKGGVIETGSDLGLGGLTEYLFDVLYVTWGIQLLVAFTTTYAWWLYLLVSSTSLVRADLDSWVCWD